MKPSHQHYIAIVEHNIEDLERLKLTIEEAVPDMHCISFRYADEALYAIHSELKHLPRMIFLTANESRLALNDCLTAFASMKGIDQAKIIVFDTVVPEAVANAYIANGATFAFQKPISRTDCKAIVNLVMSDLNGK